MKKYAAENRMRFVLFKKGLHELYGRVKACEKCVITPFTLK